MFLSDNSLFKRKSDIPTLKGYTARLVDQKWLRLAARRKHA
jgi:hypothetical protein